MNQWTKEKIRKEVDWRSFREGTQLAERGMVHERVVKGDLLTAVVGSVAGQTRRVTVRCGNYLEVQCSCPENRRSGKVCAHAVAALLAEPGDVRKEKVPVNAEVKKASLPKAQAVRIELAKNYQNSLARGHLNLNLIWGETEEVNQEGESDGAGKNFWAWLVQNADVRKSLPRFISVGRSQLSDFLQSADGHSRVYDAAGKRIEIATRPPIAVKDSVLSDDGLQVKIDFSEHQLIAGIPCLAWLDGEGIGRAPWQPDEKKLAKWQRYLEREEIFIPSDELSEMLQAVLDITLEPRAGWLGQLRFINRDPIVRITLEGSLRALDAKISVAMPDDWKDELKKGIVYTENQSVQQNLLQELQRVGFEMRSSDTWALRGEDEVFAFVADDLPTWEKQWQVKRGERFTHVLQTVQTVHPVVVRAAGRSSLTVELSYQTGGGAVIPRAKILEWIRSGRSRVRTKSGVNVVLSRRIEAEFEPLLADLGIVHPEGKLQLDRARAEALQGWSGEAQVPDSELTIPIPESISLRPYQLLGVKWLCNRLQNFGGALLADEMGLGKTLQSILALRALQDAGECKKALLLVPASLLSNWEAELKRFAPAAKVIKLHGADRDELRGEEADIIITSYGTYQRDLAYHLKVGYEAVLLDEASLIRNPDSSISRDVAKLQAKYRIALTGTPVENRLSDLWAIFRFVAPSYLGARKEFDSRYGGETPEPMSRLRARIRPFFLQRTKREVAPDLPDKIEKEVILDLEEKARAVYREIASAGLQAAEANSSAVGARAQILTTLLRLRQFCLDPALLPGKLGEQIKSEKSEYLKQLIQQSTARGGKVLVFSQFASYLRFFEEQLSDLEIKTFRLDGSVRNRGDLVSRFQHFKGSAVFLLSLKAGGYGLNLTAADTVIHTDPWWNPAVEAQATDRAHRIGQTMPVTVYKLLIRDSVEERVRALQQKKQSLISGVAGSNWTDGELRSLLA